MTSPKRIAVIMGSDSDWPIMKKCVDTLGEFGLAADVRVSSAHRTPEAAATFAAQARDNGIEVIIAAAGMAAHLAGVVAAHTTLPVIGVPMAAEPLGGLDALLSTVQMPPGVPVATVGIGAAKNAALLAVQILAVKDSQLTKKLAAYKQTLADEVAQKNQSLQKELE